MGDESARTIWVTESRTLWPYFKIPYRNQHSSNKKGENWEWHFIDMDLLYCRLRKIKSATQKKCFHFLRSRSQRNLILGGSLLPTFAMQGNLRRKLLCLPGGWQQKRHRGTTKEGVCSDPAIERTVSTYIPEISISHSIHTSCMATASQMPE